jgi:alanyl-tRNA synthetase
VGYTGSLGYFSITAESAVAAGVRRVEALSGAAAARHLSNANSSLEALRGLLKQPADLVKAVSSLQEEIVQLRRQAEHLESRILVGIRNELLQRDEIINGVSFIGATIQVTQADALKRLCFDLRNNLNDHLVSWVQPRGIETTQIGTSPLRRARLGKELPGLYTTLSQPGRLAERLGPYPDLLSA